MTDIKTQTTLSSARERGKIGGQASNYSDEVIKEALKKSGGSERGAAKIVGCKPITIRRRKEMWAQGKKLQLPVRK